MATKIVDATKLDNALGATADAIRSKTGDSSGIVFDMVQDHGFADAIAAIPTGDGRCPRVYPEADLSSSDYDIPLSSLVVSEISPHYVLRIFTHESEMFDEPELLGTYHVLQSYSEITTDAWSIINSIIRSDGYSYAGEYSTSFSGEYISASTLAGIAITQDMNLYINVEESHLIEIVQDYTQDPNATFVLQDHQTLIVTFSVPNSNSGYGVVFDFDGSSVSLTYNQTGSGGGIQHGQATKAGTLPTIISTGANRVSYDSSTTKTYTYNSNYNVFAGCHGKTAGSTLQITLHVNP